MMFDFSSLPPYSNYRHSLRPPYPPLIGVVPARRSTIEDRRQTFEDRRQAIDKKLPCHFCDSSEAREDEG